MQKPLSGQIHLSYQRGYTETGILQRYCSFNYGTYFNEHRKPLGCLRVFNEEVLAGGEATCFQAEKAGYAIFIPITGELILQGDKYGSQVIDIGQVYLHHSFPGELLTMRNEYPADKINYLYFFIESEVIFCENRLYNFDLADNPNKLMGVISDQISPFCLNIGMFAGRTDTLYYLTNRKSVFYAFVITGAFEVQGRLLHQRDGLALWDEDEVDMEALSNNAVVIVLELF